ncbi:MAG: hypothetical protein WCG48_02075 [Candidatus Berkelbacteria bacterium]
MKLVFKYDLEKEFYNLRCIRGTLNHVWKPVRGIELELTEACPDLDDKKAVLAFFDQKRKKADFDIDEKIKSLTSDWEEISQESEKRFKRLFDTDIDLGDVTAYATFASMFGYNEEESLFFVSLTSNNSNNIIIHELMHFYTHILYEEKFKKAGLSCQRFNDFKEALTFLVNTDFHDLVPNVDNGYEKQRELRKIMADKWSDCRNVGDLADTMIKSFAESNKLAIEKTV